MKKTICWMLGGLVLLLGGMIADYSINNRYFSANLHRVVPSAYQETMTFSAPIKTQGNSHLMQGAVRKIDNITIGAIAEICCNNRTYEGTLERLEPSYDDIYYATVTVNAPMHFPEETATAVICGNLHHNVLFVPKDCVTTDENGQEVVFVVQNGYAMKRTVQTGAFKKEEETQIVHGIFPGEILVISPGNIRTGDRILSP